MRNWLLLAAAASALAQAQTPPAPATIDPSKLPADFLANVAPRSLGPTTMGGRIMDVAVYDEEPRIFYVATASGGLWKTVNGGMNFEPIFQKESTVALGAAAISQNDPKRLWVGTGEGSSRNSTSWGDGVYKSLDAGKTWSNVGLKESRHIPRIVLHPKNEDVVYVAALGPLWGAGAERGVYKTTDGGKNWARTLAVDDRTGFADLAMSPKNPDELLAAAWERMRTPYSWTSGGPGSGLYKTRDGGKTWRKVTKGLPDGPLGRIGLSYYRRDPRIVYAVVEAAFGGIFKSTDGGDSWTRVNVMNPRPFYFSTIQVDPNNPDVVYVLGVQFHRSVDGGRTFRSLAASMHSDHHAIWIDPDDSNHLIVGNDGGPSQSRDWGETWEHLNSLAIGQFYAIGFDLRKPYWVYGGLQDNGSWGGPTQTLDGFVEYFHWTNVGGGDGFYVQVDPNDWRTVYSESQGGSASRLDQLTGARRSIRPPAPRGETYRFNWNTPIHLSPHNSRIVYIGGNKLFRSLNRGDNWQAISPDLTTNDPFKTVRGQGVTPEDTSAENHCTIVTIGESPRRAGVIWVGTDDGQIQVTQDGGTTWANVTANVPGLPKNTWCTRVTPSKFVDGRCYATFDGHRNNDVNPYVYVTEDFGKTWTSLAAGIPRHHSCHVIKEGERNRNLLYLGTEMGLWVSLDRGKSWLPFRSGAFPTVIVHDVAVHPRDLDLIVGTHGRSIWIIPVSALEQLSMDDLAKEVVLCRPAPSYLLGRVAGRWFGGDRGWRSPNTQPSCTIYYYLRTEAAVDPRITITDIDGTRVAQLNGSRKPGLNAVVWGGRGEGGVTRAGEYKVTLTVGDDEFVTVATVESVVPGETSFGGGFGGGSESGDE